MRTAQLGEKYHLVNGIGGNAAYKRAAAGETGNAAPSAALAHPGDARLKASARLARNRGEPRKHH